MTSTMFAHPGSRSGLRHTRAPSWSSNPSPAMNGFLCPGSTPCADDISLRLGRIPDFIHHLHLQALPTLVEAKERHGYLQLDAEVRRRVLAMSPATMDRLLKSAREAGKQTAPDNHQYCG